MAVRTSRPKFIADSLLALGKIAAELVSETWLEEKLRNGNNRGNHYFSIWGDDRQNKTVSATRLPARHQLSLMITRRS